MEKFELKINGTGTIDEVKKSLIKTIEFLNVFYSEQYFSTFSQLSSLHMDDLVTKTEIQKIK